MFLNYPFKISSEITLLCFVMTVPDLKRSTLCFCIYNWPFKSGFYSLKSKTEKYFKIPPLKSQIIKLLKGKINHDNL